MRFSLKQLHYFVAAAEAGSIKLASERINISQPSISSAIAHLEDELKIQLFVRHHAQGLSLTLAGKRMHREVNLLLKQAEGLYAIGDGLNDEVAGQLSIGCMITLAPMVAPELGQSFKAEYPDVSVSIVEGSHEQLMNQLRSVEVDAVITYDLQTPEEISFQPLASLAPHVLLAKDHKFADREEIKLSEIAREPMVLLDLPYSREYFLSLFYGKGLKPNIAVHSTSPEVVRSMVANHYGFSIVNVRPKNLTAPDGRELTTVKLSGKHRPMKIGLATLALEQKPKIILSFEEHCKNAISQDRIPGMATKF